MHYILQNCASNSHAMPKYGVLMHAYHIHGSDITGRQVPQCSAYKMRKKGKREEEDREVGRKGGRDGREGGREEGREGGREEGRKEGEEREGAKCSRIGLIISLISSIPGSITFCKFSTTDITDELSSVLFII